MIIRNLLNSGGHFFILKFMLSVSLMNLKHLVQIVSNNIFPGKKITLEGNAKIAIHHKTSLKLENSKIIVEKGIFRVGINFGYCDGGTFDPGRDICRIHMINSTLRIKGDVDFHPGVRVLAVNAEITIGEETKINRGVEIIAHKKIEIGGNCWFAQGVLVRDNDGHKHSSDNRTPVDRIIPVNVGDHCWIGQRAVILKGVTLGNNVVVAAGSIVTRNAREGTLIAGVPARKIRDHIKWEE